MTNLNLIGPEMRLRLALGKGDEVLLDHQADLPSGTLHMLQVILFAACVEPGVQ